MPLRLIACKIWELGGRVAMGGQGKSFFLLSLVRTLHTCTPNSNTITHKCHTLFARRKSLLRHEVSDSRDWHQLCSCTKHEASKWAVDLGSIFWSDHEWTIRVRIWRGLNTILLWYIIFDAFIWDHQKYVLSMSMRHVDWTAAAEHYESKISTGLQPF